MMVRRLLAHLRWADERALDALRAAPAPPAEAVGVYAHVLGAEHVWLSRLRGELPTLPVWPTLDLEECARLGRENAAGLEALAAGWTDDDLGRVVAYRNSAGDAFESTAGDILLQVATHGCYHRGQVALMLRRSGAEPASTDYIAFVRGAPAPGPRPAP